MAKKSAALQKIEDHEKLCRLMQQQTFDQIKELKCQVVRMERILIAIGVFVLLEFVDKETLLSFFVDKIS